MIDSRFIVERGDKIGGRSLGVQLGNAEYTHQAQATMNET